MLIIDVILLGIILVGGNDIPVLNPKGLVAQKERDLIIIFMLLMSIIAISVFILTFLIVWKYRAGNSQAKYDPDSHHNSRLEILWWLLPAMVIFTLAVITWKSTHTLDPYLPLESDKKPITIQVVALRWKWLFIYPQQNIATVNFIQFPIATPINFELTADGPMNSFWIPQLGGQIYAMAGMQTKRHLMTNEIGEFSGNAAEINGKGFAGMKFVAKASSQADFDSWVQNIMKSTHPPLSKSEYENLARPSENNPVVFYASTEKNLYDSIIIKYMTPTENK